MDFRATAQVGADPALVWEAVTDLGSYPQWLGIVEAAVPAPAMAGERGPAWHVTLQARLGPLVRRKRLRMVRVRSVPAGPGRPGRVRFERAEGDGRTHGTWVLTTELTPFCEPNSGSSR